MSKVYTMAEKLFTNEQIAKIHQDFLNSQKYFKIELPSDCENLELVCLEFFYAYMPVSDAISYDVSLFLKIIRDSLNAKQKLPWGNSINGEMFLNYVLSYRINNENIVDYRELFFNELVKHVQNKSITDAAIEVNYWCLEKAAYQSTDIRTISPLGIITNTYGRCGEESSFLVAALRSMCIPARQCYAPRWSHCDDNHAWVEAWLDDGKWHFMGACEPEAETDRGWFISPAQRAMLIHAVTFSNLVSDKDITVQTPISTRINVLDNYSKTKLLTIKVTENSIPVSGADVHYQLINFAELYSIAVIKTNENGISELKTGFGDLFVFVNNHGRFIYKKIDVAACDNIVEFDMNDAVSSENTRFDFHMHAPKLLPNAEKQLAAGIMAEHERKITAANNIRKNTADTFICGKKADTFADGFKPYNEQVKEFIINANGNHKEISAFLKTSNSDLKYRVMILSTLSKKDFSDITADILEEHLQNAMKYVQDFSEEIFKDNILCPRISMEMITPYREFIKNYFSDAATIKSFKENPADIFEYIEKNCIDSDLRDYFELSGSPVGVLKYKVGSEKSRKLLFVAICRTLGIPARISKAEFLLEYYNNKDKLWVTIGKNVNAQVVRNCTLKLNKNGVNYEFHKNLSIAYLDNGVYNTLKLQEGDTFVLQEGNYRIITANRMPNGDIMADVQFVQLTANNISEITLALTENDEQTKELEKVPNLNAVFFKDDKAAKLDGKKVVAWLDEGAEPTEHLFNEMLEYCETFKACKDKILFVAKNKTALKNKTLAKVHAEVGVEIAYAKNFDADVKMLFDKLNIPNKKLPIVMVIDDKQHCIFKTSGYNVGTGDMLIKYLL